MIATAIKERIYNIKADVMIVEREILPDLQERLAWLNRPDYDPGENADHEYRDTDIEEIETEIARELRFLRIAERRLSRLNVCLECSGKMEYNEFFDEDEDGDVVKVEEFRCIDRKSVERSVFNVNKDNEDKPPS